MIHDTALSELLIPVLLRVDWWNVGVKTFDVVNFDSFRTHHTLKVPCHFWVIIHFVLAMQFLKQMKEVYFLNRKAFLPFLLFFSQHLSQKLGHGSLLLARWHGFLSFEILSKQVLFNLLQWLCLHQYLSDQTILSRYVDILAFLRLDWLGRLLVCTVCGIAIVVGYRLELVSFQVILV